MQKNVRSEANRIACKEDDKSDLGLARFSYADFVVLSSVIAYGIADTVDDSDLTILLTLLGMITADIALIQAKRGIERATNAQNQEEGAEEVIPEEIAEESIVGDQSDTVIPPFVNTSSSLIRATKGNNKNTEQIKKKKRIKKIKKVRKK